MAVPDALTPLSEGDARLHVRPVTSLAQLDALTATLLAFRQVEAVPVDAVDGETVGLRVRLREPLSLAGELRRRLGDVVVSAGVEAGRLVVALDPGRAWFVEAPDAGAADGPPTNPSSGPPPARVVAPLVPGSHEPASATADVPGLEPRQHAPVRAVHAPVRAAPVATHHPAPRVAPPSVPATPTDPPRHDLAADVLARSVLDAIPDTSVLVLDATMRFRAVAGTALARHGYPRKALLGAAAREALPILPWDVLGPACRAALRGDASACAVFEATVSPVRDAANGTGAVLVLRDFTSRRRDAAVIADADEMFELSFARAPIGKAIVGPDGRFLKVNAALCRLLGYDEAWLLAMDFREITHADDLGTDEALLQETLDGLREGYVLEKRYLHADGHHVCAQLSVAVVREANGSPRWLVAQVVDITRRRQLEEELREGTERDALTGLWNRPRLDVELGLRAQEARRYGVGASLLSIDLDDFAAVNATLGRTRGDAFLRTVASAIRASVRDCDHCARTDQDDFVVLLPHTASAGAAIVADRIGEALRGCDAPGLPPGFLRASIGVAELVPGMTAERWLRHAEAAGRAAKRAGGGHAVLGTGPQPTEPRDGAPA